MNTPSTQVMLSKLHSPLKGAKFPWRSRSFYIRDGELENVPQASHSAKREVLSVHVCMEHNSQNLRNFSNKTTLALNYNSANKIPISPYSYKLIVGYIPYGILEKIFK